MKINIKVDIDKCDFPDWYLTQQRISEALEFGASNVWKTARELAPNRTGALEKSIHVTGHDWIWHVQPSTDIYAICMEEGASPHIITGNYYLYWEGCNHPVHEVHHPGNAPYKYMEEALEANVDGIVQAVLEALGDVYD